MSQSSQPRSIGLDRRSLVQAGAGAAAATVLGRTPALARSAFAGGSDAIKIGLIGCGGRGTGAALDALKADPGVVLVAMGDVFPDRLAGSLRAINNAAAQLAEDIENPLDLRERIQVPEDSQFVGFDAYQQVIDSDVDVVLLATPPHFRPAHLRAAIEADKHVFCEKPISTDAPGVRSVLETTQMAHDKGLSLVSGLCWRYSLPEMATMQRIHEGAIGEMRALYTTYLAGPLWYKQRQEGWTDMEYAMRNWYYRTWLCGDHIAEQAVHSIDKMLWAMNGEVPVRCTALGGREVRKDEKWGNIFDHYSVVYEYANGAKGFHMARQQAGCSNDNTDHFLGSSGVCDIHGWSGVHRIRGEENWDYDGPTKGMYLHEHEVLFASIRAGEPVNNGVYMAHSTMMAIMARMSAYTGRTLSWEQALASTQDFTLERYGWDVQPPEIPIAVPGKTPFV